MTSVTGRIKQVKQPRGGYFPIKDWTHNVLNDNATLGEENVHPATVGTAVDYLTRYIQTGDVYDAFKISLKGAEICGEYDTALGFLSRINGLDDDSIIAACNLVVYDAVYRSGMRAKTKPGDVHPDETTIQNIRVMVNRSCRFIDEYGPIIMDGFDLDGAYTDQIHIGDGDFVTNGVIWDMKTIKKEPDKNATLQLAIYYLMGKRSKHKELKSADTIGIFNPRGGDVYTLDMNSVDPAIIRKVEHEVIGYNRKSKRRFIFWRWRR